MTILETFLNKLLKFLWYFGFCHDTQILILWT